MAKVSVTIEIEQEFIDAIKDDGALLMGCPATDEEAKNFMENIILKAIEDNLYNPGFLWKRIGNPGETKHDKMMRMY